LVDPENIRTENNRISLSGVQAGLADAQAGFCRRQRLFPQGNSSRANMVKQNRNNDKKHKNLKRTPKKRLAGIPAKCGRCPVCDTTGKEKPAEA
jgi:hypothetical protein